MKVFITISHWSDSSYHFEGGIVVKPFTTKEAALEYMKAELEEVKESFDSVYDKEDYTVDNESELCWEVYEDNYDDFWEGEIVESEMK